MGPVRLREVEEAQQRVVAVIRRLDESGEIIISRGGDDAIIA
jgi:flagellar motor switch protein FliG